MTVRTFSSSFKPSIRSARLVVALAILSAVMVGGGRHAAAAGVYLPGQILGAYGQTYPDLSAGFGASVEIVIPFGDRDALGNDIIQSDLTSFCSSSSPNIGLAPWSTSDLTEVTPYVMPSSFPKSSKWYVEAALDVEYVHATAPAAHIFLVMAPSGSPVDLLNTLRKAGPLAPVVCMCWGGPESGSAEAAKDKLYFPASNVIRFAATGDNIASIINYPAASPNVTAVGGTVLALSSGGWLSEQGWTSDNPGLSDQEPTPDYQLSWGMPNDAREVPDVAASMGPAYVWQNGAWVSPAPLGTSISCALWAGFGAMLDGYLSGASSAPLNEEQLQAALYFFGNTASVGNNFNDVSDPTPFGDGSYDGYGQYAGLGSPRLGYLLPAILTAVSQKSIVVENTNDSGPGSLRAAITLANAVPGATITFGAGASGTIILASDLPTITSDMTIQGPASAVVTIDGSGFCTPITEGESDSKREISLSVSNLVLQNCWCAISIVGDASLPGWPRATVANTTLQDDYEGVSNDGRLKISDSSLTGCDWALGNGDNVIQGAYLSATKCDIDANAGPGFGSGLNNWYSTAVLTDCQFVGNASGQGGGAISTANATTTLTSCILSGNSSGSGWYGGAMWVNGTTTIKNCTVKDNNAGLDGGGIMSDGNTTVVGCRIAHNTASGNGGGLASLGGATQLTGCTLTGNTDGYGSGYDNGTVTWYTAQVYEFTNQVSEDASSIEGGLNIETQDSTGDPLVYVLAD